MQSFVGRLLFAILFISSALNKIQDGRSAGGAWDGGSTIAYMKPKLDAAKLAILQNTKLDLNLLGLQDKHYLAGAIALEGLGGLFFVVGNDLGAQLLLIFLATVTPIMHDFWTIKDTSSSEYLVNMIMFFKNLSLAGALLFYLGMRKEMAALKVARNKVKSS